MSCHYINGSFVDDENALISISDLGLTRGLGVSDVFRTYNKTPFHLKDHLSRLHFSAIEMGLEMPKDLDAIEEIIIQLLKSFPEDEACIKTMITGGMSPHRFLPEGGSSLIISALPLITFSEELYLNGASACTTIFERPLPQCKSLFYASAVKAMREGQKFNALEAILLNRNQELLEGLTSNFFGFLRDTLVTSSDEHVLSGITREIVLRLATEHFPLEMRPLHYSELPLLDEAFLTSCNKEVLPVTQIDGRTIGDGRVGPRTKQLMKLFRGYTQSAQWPPLSIKHHEKRIHEKSSFVTFT